MKIVSWNVNSIRIRTKRVLAWLAETKPDVLCMQETKTEDGGFPFDELRAAGYEVATFGQKSYNGVAIAATSPITDVTRGFGDDVPDDEARVIAGTVNGIRIVDLYVPNGGDLDSDRYPYKLEWYRRCRRFLERTSSPSADLVVLGDMNVTADDADVWSPDAWRGKIHCSEPEREALAHLRGFGLNDVFRTLTPAGGVWSWWDYRGVSFFKDQGLRIDHILVTDSIAKRAVACTIDRTARKGQDASDHAPVTLTLS
ncbi:MAG TPA: exodeoxyribonuclease III [Kofleriaceae bacterium]